MPKMKFKRQIKARAGHTYSDRRDRMHYYTAFADGKKSYKRLSTRTRLSLLSDVRVTVTTVTTCYFTVITDYTRLVISLVYHGHTMSDCSAISSTHSPLTALTMTYIEYISMQHSTLTVN